MKRNLFVIIGCLCAMAVAGQQDPVLMRINGKDVLRSEFERIYPKKQPLNGTEPKTINEYVGQFVDFQLKVDAARAAGIDTSFAFRNNLAGYRARLARPFLTDQKEEEVDARQLYHKMKASTRTGQVRVMHIFKYLPQTVSSVRIREAERQMDSIYKTLTSLPPADFATCVEKYSDDKKTFWIGWLQTSAEFENVAFSLPKGDFSKPFYSPQGLHIVKVIDRKDTTSFDEIREELVQRLARERVLNKGTEVLIRQLKETYHYLSHPSGVDELLRKGETDQLLFTLDGRPWTGTDFKRFAAAHPQGTKDQFDAFVAKTILDYENSRLEKKYPVFCSMMREYEADQLSQEISNREVEKKAASDEAGLSTYFKSHKSTYFWTQPRYQGAVLHCVNKKTAKKAKKLLRKLPQSEWKERVRSIFQASGIEKVKMEQGLFAEGDNRYIDKLVFKKGEPDPLESYPFTIVVGQKQKGPEDYREVRASLVTDYQRFLESLWLKRLHASAKVEINQEVLKTVNNH
ncbi:MAG: peptidylprolyl isomerase [Bacteroides sp.]